MTRPYNICPVLRARRQARFETMAALYKSGLTLQDIGNQFGCTREYIRQCLGKIGVTKSDGGIFLQAQNRKAKFEARRDAKYLKRWGCNWDQYVEIRDLKKPTRAFKNQRSKANDRGIGWELNLWQWWTIWQESGHWHDRGRSRGEYVMCRNRDSGSYAIGNVYIATCSQNAQDYQTNKRSAVNSEVRA